ncbi:ribosomal protein L7/L12 [Marinactinospora rubrisoli]|uniref:Ribosomal protein L7/L12 n=1 Tax=Marinactinospora rubrisoli TaxID=2715399 RepID=A0ABW2KM95_9ACTN
MNESVVLLLVPVAFVAGLLVAGLARRSPQRSRPPRPVSADTLERARALIAQGKPVHAIKGVREETGMGLAEAKALVDALSQGRPVPGAPAVALAARVRDLRDEDRAAAIALVVAETGMTEAEAVRFADALD